MQRKLSRYLHHISAILIVLMLCTGFYLDEIMAYLSGAISLHKSIGILIFVATIARIAAQIRKKNTARLYIINIWAIYALLVAMFLSGYFMSVFSGYGVSFFGIGVWTPAVTIDKSLAHTIKEIHEISAFGLIGAIFVHITWRFRSKIKKIINKFRLIFKKS